MNSASHSYKSSYPINMYLLSAWTISMGMSVATSCVVTMCDPLVSPKGDAKGAMPLSEMPRVTIPMLVGGRIFCAVGTEHADNGINSVLIAAFVTMLIFAVLTAFTFQVIFSNRVPHARLPLSHCSSSLPWPIDSLHPRSVSSDPPVW